MEKYGVNQLRKMFLEFFESKDHLSMNSFSLVPHNDNSLLIINSGMAPLKPYFTGQEVPPRRRVTTCQKCVRTGDIENVGKTARHLTFFEMLGNFSFGDYFKHESLKWSWEFLTEVVGLDPERLYPSIYFEDDEAAKIWTDEIGVPAEKITKFYRDADGKCDNFWEHGEGPCGPCSEIYYDRGIKYGCGKPDCKVGCECDRFMEVWNNVFSQYNNDGKGNYTDLIQKNIDTGMGLERLAVVVQDVDSVFDIDTMKAIRDKVCEMAGVTYQTDEKKDVSIRLITDHIRSATFMISDGITCSNVGRGYVLRRIIRRAARHGRLLGIDGVFLAKLAETVIEGSKDGYPELEEKKDFILNNLRQEENQFARTIDQGIAVLNDMEAAMQAEGAKELKGADAFKLYDTYGFPLDLTMEILEEKGYTVDQAGFDAAMKEQKERARGARKQVRLLGNEKTVYEQMDATKNSKFIGYDRLESEAKIIAMAQVYTDEEKDNDDSLEDTIAEVLTDGMRGAIVTDETPFYGTMGGQIGDKGVIETAGGTFVVEKTEHVAGSKIAHIGVVTKGMIRDGETAMLKVDAKNRTRTCQNHSATHLLQKALRDVLGSHVEQKGSYQDPERTRFDFSHFQAMTPEELAKVERIVNEKISENLPEVTKLMSIEDARKTGAMALFGEKYGSEVRVVDMGGYSVELCGGTHVASTGTISAFKIVSESGIAAGVRRIEAITGQAVFDYYREAEAQLKQAAALLKAQPAEVADKISHLQAEVKGLNAEIASLKSKAAGSALGSVDKDIKEVKGVKFLAKAVDGVDMNGLRDLGDQLKDKVTDGVIVLASNADGKVNLIAMAADAAIKKGAHAGNLIKAIAGLVGGGGGGKPQMAQAGGKNPAGIADALKEAEAALNGQLG